MSECDSHCIYGMGMHVCGMVYRMCGFARVRWSTVALAVGFVLAVFDTCVYVSVDDAR